MNTPTYTAQQLADQFGLQVHGDPATAIHGVATLAHAGPGQLTFLANPRYRAQLADSQASLVVLRADDADAAPGTALVAKDPYTTFAKIAALFDIAPARPPGIHPSAVIDSSAQVAASAHIGPFVSIGARSVVGDNCIIGAGSVIGEDCRLDTGCELIARVTLVTRVTLGKRVRVHPGAVLGADGFGLAMDAGKWIKVPQLGGVRIGDDCEIGANTCVDRGALEDTVLDEDVRLDNLVQIAHNVRVGRNCVMAAHTGISGSVTIGDGAQFGGRAGVADHLTIGAGARVGAAAGVMKDIPAGETWGGMPARPIRHWLKETAWLARMASRGGRGER